MGQSSSSGRRRQEYYQDHNLPSHQISSSSSYPPPPPPPPSSNPPPPNPIPSGSSYPPPPAPPGYVYPPNAPYPSPYRPYYGSHYPMPYSPYNASYHQQSSSGSGSLFRMLDSFMGRSPYPPPPYYGSHQGGRGWVPSPSPSPSMAGPPPRPPPPPPPYVEHQRAKTVKNDVNLHKGTISLVPDEQNPDHYLVSFIFDAVVDGSIIVYYFAKEGANCRFSPIYPDMYIPKRVPFQKGHAQKFLQPSGSGIDLGFFDLDDLSKPMDGDVFPLVIFAEGSPTPRPTDEKVGQSAASANAQITQAVIEKNNNGSFQVKVMKQILWVDNERYELQEIFGLVNSSKAEVNGVDDDDMGKECVICLSEPRDTAVLPCRHLCMCSECAKALRLQSNKCPICRQPVEKLMEIKVDGANQ